MKLRIRKRCNDLWQRTFGNKWRASNPDFRIHTRAYEQLMSGRLVASSLMRVENKQQRHVLSAVCSLTNKRISGQLATPGELDELKGYISENLKLMTIEFLDCMEQLSTAAGMLALAYMMREKSEALVLQGSDSGDFFTPGNIRKLFWVYVTRGEDKQALELLSHPQICSNPDKLQLVNKLCSAFALLPKHLPPEMRELENIAFADYVKDKRLAVIAPSSSGIDYTEEIRRDFDIIVRMNYRGRDTLPQSQQGLLPHISYNRRFMNSIFENPDENIDYLADLDFVVLKMHGDKAMQRLGGITNARVKLHISNFFYLGKYHLLQMIVQDLLYFEPERIKVFNANCLLSETMHDKGYYMQENALGTLTFWRQSANHSLISQYDYLRQLYMRKLIEADARLSEVLELGTAEYMRQMDLQEGKKGIFDVIDEINKAPANP